MYVFAVHRAFMHRVDAIEKKGADVGNLRQEWAAKLEEIRQLFPEDTFPDTYLFHHWRTPMELKLVSEKASGKAFATGHFGPRYDPPAMMVAEELIDRRLKELDAMLFQVAMFTSPGDFNGNSKT